MAGEWAAGIDEGAGLPAPSLIRTWGAYSALGARDALRRRRMLRTMR
jgi:hypothetical protein